MNERAAENMAQSGIGGNLEKQRSLREMLLGHRAGLIDEMNAASDRLDRIQRVLTALDANPDVAEALDGLAFALLRH